MIPRARKEKVMPEEVKTVLYVVLFWFVVLYVLAASGANNLF